MVPPRPPPSRRRRFLVLFAPLLVVLTAGTLGASLIKIPYYALGPGSVYATEPRIDLGGGEADEAGSVSFATVSVTGRVNLIRAVAGWVDPAIDVVPEERILGGRTPQENRQANQQLMDDSKQTAVQVALQALGLSEPVGAAVAQVSPGSPAEGLFEVGDVITAVDGRTVATSTELVDMIRSKRVGDEVAVTVRPVADGAPVIDPDGAVVTRRAVLVENPAHGGVPLLGVSVRTVYQDDYPHDVTIDSGTVGGPSAGLAFTLALIDVLTPGDLTGGIRVAATGTIRPDETVGAIGGVQQKAAAVRRAGVELFLVPAEQSDAEVARAQQLAGEGVDVVAVRNLDEALAALAAQGGEEVALARR